MNVYAIEPAAPPRTALRQNLLARRAAFVAGPDFAPAREALALQLVTLVTKLEPQCLGLYWPVRGEFNAIEPILDACTGNTMRLALPFVRKLPPRMEYRAWNGKAPNHKDEVGINGSDGPTTLPDVVLVPCLGFSAQGFRLGYGGGYFDRWLGAHPQVTSVGVAWSLGRLDHLQFRPETHDIALTLLITETGVE